MKFRLLIWMLVWGAVLATPPPLWATVRYDEVRTGYWQLVEDEAAVRSPSAWRKIAYDFAEVAASRPGGGRADDALYMAGLCFEKAATLSAEPTDRQQALAAWTRLAASYPRSNLADDALLRAGRLHESRGAADAAGALYRRLLAEQPSGDMAPLAHQRLAALGSGTRIEQLRHWSGPDYTRVVIDLTTSAAFEVASLPANPEADRPDRIFVDFPNTRLGSGCPTCFQVADGLVRGIRAAQHDQSTVRVVLDLEAAATFRYFPLEGPSRVVIDVFRSRRDEADLVADLIPDPATPPVPGAPAPARPLRIVVDPGHGGRDPGAIGPDGLQEKQVTLAIAGKLAAALRQTPGCRVKLTREDDRTLTLEERTAIANAFGADLFVSVHANASRSARARGVETYYLDRSSDRAARRLAARENSTTETDLAQLEHILTDVILTSKSGGSKRLAEAVQRALVDSLSRSYRGIRDLGVKRGPFYVLTGAAMPAILVETSFISHPVEARRLADNAFQSQVAAALARGVRQFTQQGGEG